MFTHIFALLEYFDSKVKVFKELFMSRPLIADKPYPSLDGISPDCRALHIISPAYASSTGELNAILQYNYHAVTFECKGFEEYAELIDSVAVAEMMHLKLLGKLIFALGAQPVYSVCPPAGFNFYSAKFVSYSRTLKNMLEDDVIAERHAVMSYAHMLDRLRNVRVKEVIARILEDEKLHFEAFTRLLAKLSD